MQGREAPGEPPVRIDRSTGCWIWTGKKDKDGYPLEQGRRVYRRLYEQRKGPIPEGLELDHLCKRRACVRPEHLEPVTRSQNNLRRGRVGYRVQARRTHCANGHDLYEKGRRTPEGGTVCIVCADPKERP